jgi:hypothetical protein
MRPALRSLLGRLVSLAEGRRAIATRAVSPAGVPSPPVMLPLRRAAPVVAASAPARLGLLPPHRLASAALVAAPARLNHCSCPTLKEEGPPRVRVSYDPADVEAFIAVADAIELAFPSAVVEGLDGEEEGQQQHEAAAQQQGGGGGGGGAGAAAALPPGGPGSEFTVTMPNGAVAFRARAAPRDAAAVLAAIRAAGGEGMLGGGGGGGGE